MAKKNINAELKETESTFSIEGDVLGKSFEAKAEKSVLGSFIRFIAFNKYGIKDLFDKGEVRATMVEEEDSKK